LPDHDFTLDTASFRRGGMEQIETPVIVPQHRRLAGMPERSESLLLPFASGIRQAPCARPWENSEFLAYRFGVTNLI
jgi:hypothetical protein